MERGNVIIAGGGLAGLTAGVFLTRAGFSVKIFEKRAIVGGRAKSVRLKGWGEIDWGQHLVLGAYRSFFRLLSVLGTKSKFRRIDGDIELFNRSRCKLKIKPVPYPFPVHITGYSGLLKGFGFSETFKMMLFLAGVGEGWLFGERRLEAVSAGRWLRKWGQMEGHRAKFWKLLAVSALNEDIEFASASMLYRVLKDGFLRGGDASMPYLCTVPLSQVFAIPAVEYIKAGGGEVITSMAVGRVNFSGGKFRSVTFNDGSSVKGDWLILAVEPWAVSGIFDGCERNGSADMVSKISGMASRLLPSSIVSVYFKSNRKIIQSEYAGFLEGVFHWLFPVCYKNKGSGDVFSYCMVCSSAGEIVRWGDERIKQTAVAQISSSFPDVPLESLEDFLVIKEKKATFSPFPSTYRYRVSQDVLADMRMLVAGDWTDTGLPSTLESAAMSGLRCSEFIQKA